MDAHYHKVMQARENIKETKPKLYFAYSTILDRKAFEEWRDHHSYQFFDLPTGKIAKAQNVDLVFDFQSRWWGGRVAGLTDKPGAQVYGMLFEIPANNWPVVEHKEGAVTGMCYERPVKVLAEGKEYDAVAFTTVPSRATTQGVVSTEFIHALIEGAKSSGLPSDYINHLEQFLK